MAKKNKYQRLYDLLIRGFPQTKICRLLRSDKGQISRMTNMLVDNGFLVCINNRDRVRFYEATKKKLTEEDTVILSTIKQKGRISTQRRGCYIRCHAISYLTDVKKMGDVPWDKSWSVRGVSHCLFKHFFVGVGDVSFQWMKGKSSNQIRINLPSIHWDVGHGNPELHLRGIADSCGTWFMKTFSCDLRGLKPCGHGHFEMPVHDPGLIRLAQGSSVKRDGLVLDSSLGYPEFGSVEGFDVLGELLGLPDRVSKLERQVESIVCSVEKLNVSIERLVRLFDVPVRVDELKDVT